MDVHSVIAFRHFDHGDLYHGDLRLIELLIGLFLQKSVGFPHGEVGEIQERDIPVIPVRDILLYEPVFIGGREPQTEALIAPELVLDASLQKVEINLCLQTGKNADVAAALRAGFPNGQILQHLADIQGIKFFVHRFPPRCCYLSIFQSDSISAASIACSAILRTSSLMECPFFLSPEGIPIFFFTCLRPPIRWAKIQSISSSSL